MKLKGQALIQWLVSLEEQGQDSSELSLPIQAHRKGHMKTQEEGRHL